MGRKEVIENIIFKDFGFLFSYYGYVYSAKDTAQYTDSVASPLGGTPFPIKGSLWGDYDSTSLSFTLQDNMEIDKAHKDFKLAFNNLMEQLFKSLSNEEPIEEIDEIVGDYDYKMNSVLKFTVDEHGLMRYAIRDRKVWLKQGAKATMKVFDSIEYTLRE